ncbi:hypothetical protein D3C77_642120 [compost metagenome]
MTTTKTIPDTMSITNAESLAIAAGRAALDANNAPNPETQKALSKLSLRFAELALELVGGESGNSNESAGV